jgi:hypothetical protein
MIISRLEIESPKRNSRLQTGWEGFFPYYAGYPESFADKLIVSAGLDDGAVVLDPWNGSGTTTYAASRRGLTSIGMDLNPVMVIIARARLLQPSEADTLDPLAKQIVVQARKKRTGLVLDRKDPLLLWFGPEAAKSIRSIEQSIELHAVGNRTITNKGVKLGRISGTAATFYAALFAVCRDLVSRFRSSNPTWLRYPRDDEARLRTRQTTIEDEFCANIAEMSVALDQISTKREGIESSNASILLADTTAPSLTPSSVDLVVTSPPYCTRIDYTAATRVELAVLWPLLSTTVKDLGRKMIGSTSVPDHAVEVSEKWGGTCLTFLDKLKAHKSKASSGYYFKTHADYFDKMARAMGTIATAMKPNAIACLVVQDSYYKDLHNDLPTIVGEMGEAVELTLKRTKAFHLSRSMSGINPHTRTHGRPAGAVESVLCFKKPGPAKRRGHSPR